MWYEQCRYPEIWSKVVKERIFKAFVTLYEFPQDDRQFECRVLMVWSQVLDVKRGVPAPVCPLVKKTIVLDYIWIPNEVKWLKWNSLLLSFDFYLPIDVLQPWRLHLYLSRIDTIWYAFSEFILDTSPQMRTSVVFELLCNLCRSIYNNRIIPDFWICWK